jgi:hypothetical protein
MKRPATDRVGLIPKGFESLCPRLRCRKGRSRVGPVVVWAAALLLSFQGGDAQAPEFSFLAVVDGTLITTYRLGYRIEPAETFTRSGPTHRRAIFNDVPFEISLAAFIRQRGVVMIHAERVADGSGASDYTHFPEADWPDGRFRLKPPECFVLPPESIEGEHDLKWLQDNGFKPSGTLHLAQYFASTDDFNEELVISFLLKVDSCDDEAANGKALEALRADISVTRIE